MTSEERARVVEGVVADLVRRGAQRGFLTVHEVQHDLVEAGASADEFDRVSDVLRLEGIRVEEDLDNPVDDPLDDESISVSDPVKMWLQEIGRYRLLTSQQEVELAMHTRWEGFGAEDFHSVHER